MDKCVFLTVHEHTNPAKIAKQFKQVRLESTILPPSRVPMKTLIAVRAGSIYFCERCLFCRRAQPGEFTISRSRLLSLWLVHQDMAHRTRFRCPH